MSIVRILPEFLEHFSLEVTPKKTYSVGRFDALSGTYGDVTGSINLFTRRSNVEKEIARPSPFLDTTVKEGDELDIDGPLREAKRVGSADVDGANFDSLRGILNKVNALPQSLRKQQKLEIIRFEPPVVFDDNFMRKKHIREQLFPFYRPTHPSFHWAYTNYNSLNFFTGSTVPNDSVLMYPNTQPAQSVTGNVYLPQAAFSFDFRINPRYSNSSPGDAMRAGTIFHMSGVYALSLLTGSNVDKNGLTDRFRLALQVLSGTYTPPSEITGDASGIFLSDDNVLKKNHWHRVVVRWGTSTRDSGTGSFVVDGENVGTFVIPSASLSTNIAVSPDILFVGNFYEGGGNQSLFFATNPATREGLVELSTVTPDDAPPTDDFSFTHPLNAELHELRIWDEYIADDTFVSGGFVSPTDLSTLLFYVPPFFTAESPVRTEVSSIGGVLQTPFFAIDGTTDDPFNSAMSFGVGALYINLENFTRDFARENYPRAWALTASQINVTSDVKTAIDFLYSSGSVRKRNLTILPCDDGQFTPDFSLLTTGVIELVPSSGNINFNYANDLGSYDPSLVRLTELIPSTSFYPTLTVESGSLFNSVVGATPDNPGVDPGEVLAVFQRTRDNSSNEVTIFDISNVFYGNRIRPESVLLTDPAMTGSGDAVSMKLRDDGFGSLYRADADTELATWNSVGNVIYDEGIIVVKSPHAPFFGKEAYTAEFRGSRNIHTLKVRVPAAGGLHTSSSNPAFQPISASMAANEYDPRFVYITGINLHDENLNVVMKTTIAQPILKRTGDKLVIKIAMDF